MRQVLDKLSEIQELQRFQIEKDRDRDIFAPFLLARKYVLRAELQTTPEERRTLLAKADEEMTKAIHAVMLDINTTARSLANAVFKPYANVAHTLDAYMNYIARDMQALNQFIGIELQVLAHFGKVCPRTTFPLVNMESEESCCTFPGQTGNPRHNQHTSVLLIKLNTSG